MRASLTAKNVVFGNDIVLATSLLDRMRGLLGKRSLPPGQGLLLRPCKGIHTFFMKFPIDAVFLDKENRVIAVYNSLQPNHMTSIHRAAHAVLELPAGTLNAETVIGDILEFT